MKFLLCRLISIMDMDTCVQVVLRVKVVHEYGNRVYRKSSFSILHTASLISLEGLSLHVSYIRIGGLIQFWV
jgi:hypothetical protein